MNKNFEIAAKAVKSITGKSVSLWENLVLFAVAMDPTTEPKENFKTEERLARTEVKVEIGKNSTYRVAKGVIVNALAKGVALLDADGKPRGKTDIEDQLKAAKVKKSAADRFKIVMASANTIADELTDAECISAAALANDLLNKVSASIRKAA
jgi:hypothetical protein